MTGLSTLSLISSLKKTPVMGSLASRAGLLLLIAKGTSDSGRCLFRFAARFGARRVHERMGSMRVRYWRRREEADTRGSPLLDSGQPGSTPRLRLGSHDRVGARILDDPSCDQTNQDEREQAEQLERQYICLALGCGVEPNVPF